MIKSEWIDKAIFYHIYPLGLCGAPEHNAYAAPVCHRLNVLLNWLDHIQSLGANAIYLGPVFQSASHGYDTVDYFQVDSRLGDENTLARFAEAVHQRGLHLVLDGVFNHVGRDFWAFKDVLYRGESSAYCDWFKNLRFGEANRRGDPFHYQCWHGHESLPELNLSNTDVREHLFEAIGFWMNRFQIDGLRLDAADCIDMDFLQALCSFTKNQKAGFWLLGEVVHGNYSEWVNPNTLDSVTNYETYKGLYSSLNEANYFEIAHSLERQFGPIGLYRGLYLYNFVDNHDVTRVASKLVCQEHLVPLYILLFTMPGIPSVYYGSEWGLEGIKDGQTDKSLRPALDIEHMNQHTKSPMLMPLIQRLSMIRQACIALRRGNYRPLSVSHQQFAFVRALEEDDNKHVLVILNSVPEIVEINLSLPGLDSEWVDLLTNETYQSSNGQAHWPIPPLGGRILEKVK